MAVLRRTESKVCVLEHDLGRIEEKQNESIPELGKQLRELKEVYSESFEVVTGCQEYVAAQFDESLGALARYFSSFLICRCMES
jgi:sulfur transfer protein SufE